jgi:hypothetical protein
VNGKLCNKRFHSSGGWTVSMSTKRHSMTPAWLRTKYSTISTGRKIRYWCFRRLWLPRVRQTLRFCPLGLLPVPPLRRRHLTQRRILARNRQVRPPLLRIGWRQITFSTSADCARSGSSVLSNGSLRVAAHDKPSTRAFQDGPIGPQSQSIV